MRRGPIFGGLVFITRQVFGQEPHEAHGVQQLRRQGRTLHFRSPWRASPYAEAFARGLDEEFTPGSPPQTCSPLSTTWGAGWRSPSCAPRSSHFRRLLIGESREFPALGAKYFNRAPGQVLEALASGFDHLGRVGLLRVADARIAAAQFAYLVVGELLNRAMLAGTTPPRRARSSPARGKACRRSWLDIGLRGAAA